MKIYGNVYLEFLGPGYKEVVIALEAYLGRPSILMEDIWKLLKRRVRRIQFKNLETLYDLILHNLGEDQADNFFNFLRSYTFAVLSKDKPHALKIGSRRFEVVKGELTSQEKNVLKDIIKKGLTLSDVMEEIGEVFYKPVKVRDYSKLYKDILTRFRKLIRDLNKLFR